MSQLIKEKIKLPILVEGKYDRITLKSMFDSTVITTDGFGVFNSKEKRMLITRLASDGIIVLVDSDGGGRQIRSFISSILPKEKIHNVFIPKIKGRERRKTCDSKAGLLGVEGMSREVLSRLLAPFIDGQKLYTGVGEAVSKLDFYEDGLSGGKDSSERRRRFCAEADLPDDMTANALLEAVNLLYSYEEYKSIVQKINI